jgi:molybdopterin/thiamine biosynthesis adenylyltransferase
VTADALRRVARAHGTRIALDPSKINQQIPIDWCRISDERKEVTTRRDDGRPVNGFLGKSVHVWGCGGLGSWMAEFVARAGASHITLCDPGVITGGLLVRQNYMEDDIGHSKADALAKRLSSIRNDLVVTVAKGRIPDDLNVLQEADVLIDATVSNGITQILDVLAASSHRRAIIAQVATDANSGTLGILSVCAPKTDHTPSTVDWNAGEFVKTSVDLETYHKLWQEPLQGDELTPTRGCSIPTFHGSAADLAAVAAVLASLLGKHLQSTEIDSASGTHLVSLPHAGGAPPHCYIPITTETMESEN